MSLQDRLSDFITAVGTDYKQLRTWISGSANGDLTGLTTTTKASLVAAINEVDGKVIPPPDLATESDPGIIQIATQSQVNAGSADNRAVTPLKFQNRLSNYAQPLSSNLTTLAQVVSGAFGRSLLGTEDDQSARTALGLAAVAISGSASDITTGTLPNSVLPPLAITDTFVVDSQAQMLALTAERGDVAVRTDTSRSYILMSEPASTLSNWVQLTAAGDVISVAGKTGAVTLNKGDVGLNNVDNTSDANKPVSSAQQTAINARMAKSANLSDVANTATARTNLSVYSQAQLGNPETNLVSLYETAKS